MPVQIYKSTDVGAPTLSGTVGSMINLLNRCLVTGYVGTSILSLVRSGTLAIATVATNTTLVTGQYFTISGANEADYNGTFQITVLDNTTFTYVVPNSPTSPATGTLLYSKAPLGWQLAFTGTNLAVYRSTSLESNRFFLRINENGVTSGGQKEIVAVGFETMTDVSAGTGQFPTAAQLGYANSGITGGVIWQKSITADATVRSWCLVGDEKTFYLSASNGSWQFLYGFGHMIPFRPGDGYNTFIGGQRATNVAIPTGEANMSNSGNITSQTQTTGVYLARAYTQVFGSIPAINVSYHSAWGNGQYAPWASGQTSWPTYVPWGMPFPNAPDMGAIFLPVFQSECISTYVRGRLPGFYVMWTYNQPYAHYDEITNVTNLPGTVKLIALQCDSYIPVGANANGRVFMDFNGPWA